MPYALLDERTKKSNRDSLREAIRTMVGYGYEIDPPDQEGETLALTPRSFKALKTDTGPSTVCSKATATALLSPKDL